MSTVWFNEKGALPVDYEAYHRAGQAIRERKSIYPSVEAAQQIWKDIHLYETDVLTGRVRPGARRIVGPYVYPPTLALWLVRANLGPSLFLISMALSVYGFSLLWLRINAASSSWLLLVVGSLDVLLSLAGGNVEIFLIFLMLSGALLLWRGQGVWAAGPIAVTVLIKPFYALFFSTYGLLVVASKDEKDRARTFRTLGLAAALSIILIGLDVYGWGPDLRSQASAYLFNAMAYQWLQLPVYEQTPMSLWNRTLLQGLVNAGWSPHNAQIGVAGAWAIMVFVSSTRVWGRHSSFATLFALAFVIFYWIRPVGWGFPYLEIVALVALWPALTDRLLRHIVLVLAIGLMLSHWLALFYTSQAHGLLLLTLQKSNCNWETWLTLPLCWVTLLWAVPKLSEIPGKRSAAALAEGEFPSRSEP